MHNTSSYWVGHFKNNLKKQRINWNQKPEITNKEKAEILYSLKAWQLGETSEGHNLTAAARKFSLKSKDPEYLEAIRLFIQEEQKHGNNLGTYLDLIGEQRIKKDWGDSLFRKVRYFNTSMELWTVVVIIVESAAQVFYKALHDATNCKLLKDICKDILLDEAHHIRFQNERLSQIFNRSSFYVRAFSVFWYCLLFFVTIHAVWFGHHRAFKAGGIKHDDFMRRMYYKFFYTIRFLHRDENKDLKKDCNPNLAVI